MPFSRRETLELERGEQDDETCPFTPSSTPTTAATGPPLEQSPEKPPAAPSPPTPPPKTETWTHDPPEHLQIEKVTWRRRGPEDDLDDDEEEYDAFGGG